MQIRWLSSPESFAPTLPLPPFALQIFAGWGVNTVINDPNSFKGCGGNSVWELNRIEFRHDGYGGLGDKWVNLDHIFLG